MLCVLDCYPSPETPPRLGYQSAPEPDDDESWVLGFPDEKSFASLP
jgi:hypothetical protein